MHRSKVFLDEFRTGPHVLHGQIGVTIGIILEMLLNGIVAEMNVLLSRGQIEMFGAETQITIFEDPDRQWIPIGDEKPLTNVELRVVNQQRAFDVLLNDELTIADHCRRAQLQNVFQTIVNNDT